MITLQDKLKSLQVGKTSEAESVPTQETTIGGETVKVPTLPKEQEKEFHVFWHTSPSCRMVTETGRVISFIDYRYVTDVSEDIAYLKKEVAAGHPNLYTKEGQEIMTSSQLDPMQALRDKFYKEFEEEQKAKAAAIASGNLQDFGSTEQQKLNPGSTTTSGVTAAGSVSADS